MPRGKLVSTVFFDRGIAPHVVWAFKVRRPGGGEFVYSANALPSGGATAAVQVHDNLSPLFSAHMGASSSLRQMQ